MKDLFDLTSEKNSIETKTTELKITPKKGKLLSKNQQVFNSLIKKIETLNADIEKERFKSEKILSEYSTKIKPTKAFFAENKIVIAKKLAKLSFELKFNSKQKQDIETVILWLCSDAFSIIEPDEETKAFYDLWSETSYDEELKEQKETLKDVLSEELKSKFGIDLDLADFEDSPESYARLREKLQELDNNTNPEKENKKKTKKQREKEAQIKKEEGDKLKSIRNIYISLAKMLHPDLVADDQEKVIREELMKKVTTAYTNKNLSELLKLELEWVASESNNIDTLSEEKLELYISSLKEQIAELQNDKLMLHSHPRYQEIYDFLFLSEKKAVSEINNLKRSLQTSLMAEEYVIRTLENATSKKVILELMKGWMEVIETENYFKLVGQF